MVSGVLQLGFLDLFGEKRLVIHSLLPLSFGLGINKLGFLISNFPCFSDGGASSIEYVGGIITLKTQSTLLDFSSSSKVVVRT